MYGGQPTAKRFLIITPGSLVKVGVMVGIIILFYLSDGDANTLVNESHVLPIDRFISLCRTGLQSFASG